VCPPAHRAQHLPCRRCGQRAGWPRRPRRWPICATPGASPFRQWARGLAVGSTFGLARGLQRADVRPSALAWAGLVIQLSSIRAAGLGLQFPSAPVSEPYIALRSEPIATRNGCCWVPGHSNAHPPCWPALAGAADRSPRSLYIELMARCRSCCATPADRQPHHHSDECGHGSAAMRGHPWPTPLKPGDQRFFVAVTGLYFGLRLWTWPSGYRAEVHTHRSGPGGRPHPGGNRSGALLRHQPKILAIDPCETSRASASRWRASASSAVATTACCCSTPHLARACRVSRLPGRRLPLS